MVVVVGRGEGGLQFKNDLLFIFLTGGFAEALVPLIGTLLHVDSRLEYLPLRESPDEERPKIPAE